MAVAFDLVCRACGRPDPDAVVQYCATCFGPLDVVPRWDTPVDRATIGAGPETLWRYAPLLAADPPPPGGARGGAGWTRLHRAERLGAALGLDRLWLKVEGDNPTGSFKDRLVALALARALHDGRAVAACASTGNLARAVLAGAAACGIAAVVLVPEATPGLPGGPAVVRVRGGYDAVNRLSVEAAMAHEGWAWVNVGLRAWYTEGAATVAHEISEQLGWRSPAHVMAPIASGASLLRMHRAFDDLHRAGLLPNPPVVRVSAAQPSGCSPVAAAFTSGSVEVAPVRPATVATSLAMGDPPDGPDLLAVVRASGGAVDAVPEDEIAGGQQLLAATEGIATEPGGGVVVAALRRLAAAGVVRPDEDVVVVLTAGPTPGEPAPAGVDGGASSIEPTLEALAAVLPDHVKESFP